MGLVLVRGACFSAFAFVQVPLLYDVFASHVSAFSFLPYDGGESNTFALLILWLVSQTLLHSDVLPHTTVQVRPEETMDCQKLPALDGMIGGNFFV